jgi:hypothetical protein
MKERAELSIEIEETLTMRRDPATVEAFCEGCEAPALMTAPPTAAAMTGSSEREIFRLVESGAVHFSETGRLLICIRSLKALSEPNVIAGRQDREP